MAICTVPPADSVGVGVAVGGHDHSVPHGGHDESDEYQENTLASPCTLKHILPSLRLENQDLDLRLASLYRVIGGDNIHAGMVTESDTLDFNIMYTFIV